MAQPRTQTTTAFTVVELLGLIAALVVLLALLLFALRKSTARAAKLGCVNHLKQVGVAFRTWAIDHEDVFPMQLSVSNGGARELATGRADGSVEQWINRRVHTQLQIREGTTNRLAVP